MNTRQFDIILSDDHTDLEDILEEIADLTFHDYLNTLVKTSGMKKSQIIEASGLDRTYCYQIFDGRRTPKEIKSLL